MSKEYASPLSLELKSSALLTSFQIAVHIIALIAVLYANLPVIIKLAGCILLTVSYRYYQSQTKKRCRIVWLKDNQWFIYTDDQQVIEAKLTPMSFLANWLVILALKTEEGKRLNFVIPFDALDKHSYRRLKVKLTMLSPTFFQQSRDQEF